MAAEEPTIEGVVLEGRLEQDGVLQPVTLRYASRLSLYVGFSSGAVPADGCVFARLRVTMAGREFDLSRCSFRLERTRKGCDGRLIFLDDVYDFHSLLAAGKFVNLKGFFQSLPLVLSQKDGIRPEFRDYVARSLYDLAVYKRFFDEQDRVFANELEEVAEIGQQTLLQTEGRAFFKFFDQQLEELGRLVKDFDKESHEKHGYYLRRMAWHFILGSEFLKRTNLKPRGYAGDAEMMVMAYENKYVGRFLFNKLLHKHPLETPAAQAVRNRRRRIPRTLREVLARFPNEPVRFFSVASGPACELQDLFLDSHEVGRLQCALLDQDSQALAMAREGIERIEAMRDAHIDVAYHNDSVRTMLKHPNLAERFGRFHFLYSMGLFDYLTPPVAKALLRRMLDLLVPGGTMVIGNYHVDNPTRFYMAYWMDWVLYYRSEADFRALAEDLPDVETSVGFDESGTQMFLQVTKLA